MFDSLSKGGIGILIDRDHHSQVLQIAARKRDMGDDLDLPIPNLLDVDIVAEIARAAFDLDAIMQELLERAEVEDLVADGLGAVDRVL
jgi:hypothetical protein